MEYEEIRPIKQSEKGAVLLVREKGGERQFVQKVMPGQYPVYEMLQSCPHPYFPKVYEVAVSGSTTSVLEEYIDGQSVSEAALTERSICAAAKELCSALEFLHGKGIIHRDIKPSNVLLAKDGHIRLIDFDAARLMKDKLEQDTRLLGTRGYAPPEQYGFAQTDARADIYALGVMLEQLLGEKAQKSRYKRIIRKCTNLNPDKRYQSAGQVKRAFSYTQRGVLYSSIAILLIALLWNNIPRQPVQQEEIQSAGTVSTGLSASENLPSASTAPAVLPAPGKPHWDGETGIAIWGNVLESGSGGSPAYSWRLYRYDTATPPAPDESNWIMRGNMYGSGGSKGPTYAVNLAGDLLGNGFYYFTVSAEGDGVNYTNSPFVVSDAFEYTGESAPPLPVPAGLAWEIEQGENGLQYYATWSNLHDYIDSDSFCVEVYNQSGDYVGRTIWTKADIGLFRGYKGIRLTRIVTMEASGRYRFTVQALTSRANEYRSSLMPSPVPEESYSPWLEVTG